MYLDVGDGHTMHYKEYGTPTGKPVVVLHGGPGGGMQRSVLKFFNLKRWRVIMYDQRGCGLSTPFLSLHRNTTWDLVADIEKLRIACGIERWTIFGGSWGSTLALAYASKHMDRVSGLVLRGVCLLEPWETEWLYAEGGASRLYPEAWLAFSKAAGGAKGNLTKTYKRLLSKRRTRKKAAAAWWGWEAAISSLKPKADRSTPKQVESLAILENHYFSNDAWLKPHELIKAAVRIPKTVPVVIVQGRYDLVCPAASAFALAEKIPHASLHMTLAGHASSDPETAKMLRKALEKLADK